MIEEWRSVIGYEKFYEVNDQGLVHSKKTGKFLKPYQGQVYLRKDGTTETVYVFDIVAKAFGFDLSNIYPIDGNKENGQLNNIGIVSEFHTVENTDEWKYIPGYEGIYQASVQGQIRSVDRISHECGIKKFRKSCVLEPELQRDGYYHVNLSKENQVKTYLVHRLVALAFIPNPSDKPQVNHIDGNKLNNLVENLEWVTQSENMQHAKGLLFEYGGDQNDN